MKRRTYLTAASATAVAAFAGCMGGDELDDENNTTDDDTGDDDVGDDTDTDANGDENGTDDDEDENGEEHSELVGTFDDFEDLDLWGVVEGSLDADDEEVYEGSQSALLSTSESQELVRIVRELDEPIDAQDVVPGLALSTSGAANPIIQLYDEDGDYYEYQQHVHADHPFFRHNFGHTAVSGEPDLSEITEIQIGHWSGDETEAELWIDDLHFVPRVNTGQVMIQFQGGHESDYTEAYPVLEEYGLTASTFVPTSRIRASSGTDGDRLTESQLEELADAGWAVGTVGARGLHRSAYDDDEVESELLDPLEWFDENGYDDARYFAFPGGRYDQEMYDLVEENYDLGFAGRYQSQGYASNPYTITRISGDGDQRNLDEEQVTEAIDWTAEYGGITTIVFYLVDDDDEGTLEAMASHLAELEDAGEIDVTTPEEVADQYVL